MTTVYYVDALAGAGKTCAATQYAHRIARLGSKVLLVQPSIHLIQQTLEEFHALRPEIPVKAIYGYGAHGAGTSSHAVSDIVQHFSNAGRQGEVLIITHAAFLRVPHFHNPDRWHLLVDEIPQADWCEELHLAETHHLITGCISTQNDKSGLVGTRYSRVEAGNRSRLKSMLDNENGDEVWDHFRGFTGKLLSPHWQTYVLDYQFADLIDGKGDRRSLWAFGVLSPSLVRDFKSATIMGAHFKSPFENGHGWAMRRMRRAPMLTWIMASDTSQRRS